MNIKELEKMLKDHEKWLNRRRIKRANTENIDFTKIKSDIKNINLQKANLYKANFQNKYIIETNFNEAYLEKANFSKAKLIKVNFSKANLIEANFNKANLLKTNFSEANIYGANLQNATYLVNNILKAFWDIREKHLILELMAHDAKSCGIKAMNKWAKNETGCPFKSFERNFYFNQNKDFWLSASSENKIPKINGYKLLEALAKACEVKL